ncbi:FAD-dependent oxidoreductase [Ructibacterium gallinarum]|uniref:FAD-dependent oxidoreductase n=1 Tax=Ructibacterium gallinarum TaxID=2779355 RepID=A0A9D5RAI1_9FIRM|nr:FAD-dependent oxidoreductase [Ructibacterium gallinarum]MBE5039118.1 FAD-dependent oxidoreductase [Ructibacterium gallinarum]
MNQIKYEKQIEVRYETDVCVVGGGPAGVAAAVSAARNGAKVCLFEKEQCFGGAATVAKVPAFMRFSDGVHFLAGGIGREIFDKLYGNIDDTTIEFSIPVEKLKTIYDDMVCEAGITFLFDTALLDVQMSGNTVEYAILQGHEQIFAVRAKYFIDATGDGFLSVAAGADFAFGDKQGNTMPATLCSIWGDIDWSRAVVELGRDPDNRCLKQAFEDGVFTIKDPGLPGMWRFDRHYGGGNIGHVFHVDGTDEKSITDGIVQARKRMREYEYYYTHYLEGYENAKLLLTGDILGIRETRRIVCEYMARLEDYQNHAVFADEIGRYCYPIDIHSHTIGVKTEEGEFYAQGYQKGKSYGISYRSLLPKKLDNVLVAGRCVGAERAMMGSMRVMPCCFITGMAAGTSAALANKANAALRQIDMHVLRSLLIQQGAYLP